MKAPIDPAEKSTRGSVLGIIPARGGSKGLREKNIAPLNGIPLIAHTITAARQSRMLDDLLVSTDSEAIAAVARTYHLPVPWLRPPELARDTSRVQDAIRHAIGQHPDGERFEYILLLQPTAPLRQSFDIDNAIALAFRYQVDSVVSFVEDASRHPYLACRIDSGTDDSPPRAYPVIPSEPGKPRQEFPRCAFRNGAIYLVRRRYFLKENTFISPDCVPYIMPRDRSANIDTKEDIVYAEYLIGLRETKAIP